MSSDPKAGQAGPRPVRAGGGPRARLRGQGGAPGGSGVSAMMGNRNKRASVERERGKPPGSRELLYKPAPEPGPRPLAHKAHGRSFGSKKRVCAPGLPVCAGLQRTGWEKGKPGKRETAVVGRLAQEAPSSARGGTWEAGRGPLSGVDTVLWAPAQHRQLSGHLAWRAGVSQVDPEREDPQGPQRHVTSPR